MHLKVDLIVAAVGTDGADHQGVAAEHFERIGDVGSTAAVPADHVVGDKRQVDVIEAARNQVVAEARPVGQDVVIGNGTADKNRHFLLYPKKNRRLPGSAGGESPSV